MGKIERCGGPKLFLEASLGGSQTEKKDSSERGRRSITQLERLLISWHYTKRMKSRTGDPRPKKIRPQRMGKSRTYFSLDLAAIRRKRERNRRRHTLYKFHSRGGTKSLGLSEILTRCAIPQKLKKGEIVGACPRTLVPQQVVQSQNLILVLGKRTNLT